MSEEDFPKLNSGEEIIMQDSAKRVLHGGQTKQKGTLVLTNQRLIFGRHTSFLFFLFKKTRTDVDLKLEQIEKVGTEGTFRKSLKVNHSEAGNIETELFQISDVEDWVAAINESMKNENESV